MTFLALELAAADGTRPCKCLGCGRELVSALPLAEITCTCKPTKQPQLCQRLLFRERRRVECPGCAGKPFIKIFGCEKHGECAIDKAPDGVRSCDGCDDKLPLPELPQPPRPLELADVTIVVTSFLRFDCLRRFLTSCRFFYPGVPIVVADQSGDQAAGDDAAFCQSLPGVTWLELPFDAGLSACRNAAVAAATTPLILLCDDDEVVSDDTQIGALVDVLNHEPTIGLVAGLIREATRGNGDTASGWAAELSIKRSVLHASDGPPAWLQTPAGTWYRRTDRYINVFCARRQVLLDHPWDETHKIRGEHIDHVLSLWEAGVGVAYTPQCIVGEIKSTNEQYAAFRGRDSGRRGFEGRGLVNLAGNWASRPEPGIARRPSATPTAEPPCIVLLTVGHTGSSITAGLLSLVGWHLPDNDPEFNEPRWVREANEMARHEGGRLTRGATDALADLPRPWLLKDPRFCETLEAWLPGLASQRPLLLWLDRDRETTAACWTRRGESVKTLDRRLAAAARHFELWPWAKQRVQFDDLVTWAAAVDPRRATGAAL